MQFASINVVTYAGLIITRVLGKDIQSTTDHNLSIKMQPIPE